MAAFGVIIGLLWFIGQKIKAEYERRRARQHEERMRVLFNEQKVAQRAAKQEAKVIRREKARRAAEAAGELYMPSSSSEDSDDGDDEQQFRKFMTVPTGPVMSKEEAKRLEEEKKSGSFNFSVPVILIYT